jgi:predicted P-loop ATPase
MVRWRHYDENEKGPAGGYGIPTGSINGFFVVDVDMKEGKDGGTTLVALAAGRVLPETKTVLTPTGGAHLYFRLPPGVYVPNRQALGPGLDVRGEGGYVVGPDSKHKNGGTYEDAGGALVDAPPWLLDLVVKPRTSTATVTAHVTLDPQSPAGVRAIEWAKAFLARAEPAIEGQDGSGRLFHVACHLMYSSLSHETLQELVEEVYNPRCVPPWSPREIEHKLEDADRIFAEPRGLPSPDFLLGLAGKTTNTGPKTPDELHEYTFAPGMRSNAEMHKVSISEVVGDLYEHVDWAGVLQFDTFRDRVVAIDPPMKMDAETAGLSDNDVQLVRLWLEFHGKKLSTIDVRCAIETVARRRAFDPRVDWLGALVWDGVPRLDRVLPAFFSTADTEYERTIGPRWFIGLVARAMTPGCQMDCTLILEGPQGIGKTSAFRALMPVPSWYAETTCGVDAKDFYENLRGVWLMAFDELDSLSRSSTTRVNGALTSTRDRYRNSYGHYSNDYPRTCGFCGSTNQETYLKDSTGGRRFWPVVVLARINIAKLEELRDQIWAEAYVRWRAREPWHVDTPELRALCEDEQEARLEGDPWEAVIREWLSNPAKVSWTPVPAPTGPFKGVQPYDASQGITIADVLEHAIQKLKGQRSSGDFQRVGFILRRIKMQRVRKQINGVREWRHVFSAT